MSAMDEEGLDELIQRIEQGDNHDDDMFDADKLKRDIEKIRKIGYATTAPRPNQTIKSIARLLPLPNSMRPVAVSIGGPKSRIIQAIPELNDLLDKVIAKYY